MDQPIRSPQAIPACTARPASPQQDGAWMRALLRLFAELACRLR